MTRQPKRHKKKRRFTSSLSDHFSKRDFVCRCGHCKQLVKVSLGLVGALEWLREMVGQRITITKGYMCHDAVDKQQSLRRNFYHMGIAAQITAEHTDLLSLAKHALTIPEFRGIGLCQDTGVLHVDTRKANERLIWIESNGNSYQVSEDEIDRYFPPASHSVS